MNLVIPDLDNVKKLFGIFSEAARVLKKRGILIFSTIHPLYLSPDQDFSDRPVNFKKENYFKEGSTYKAEAITKKGSKMFFNETHFSLEFISRLLQKNKFLIKELAEAKAVPRRKIFLPKYLVIKCIRLDK